MVYVSTLLRMDVSEKNFAVRMANTMIGDDEPPPCAVINAGGTSEALLVADHAGIAIPRALGTLGLGERELGLHIACDIGIGAVTGILAGLLDAPAIIAG